jgi:hypothetical protein
VQLGSNLNFGSGFNMLTLPTFTDIGTSDFLKIINGGTGNAGAQMMPSQLPVSRDRLLVPALWDSQWPLAAFSLGVSGVSHQLSLPELFFLQESRFHACPELSRPGSLETFPPFQIWSPEIHG